MSSAVRRRVVLDFAVHGLDEPQDDGHAKTGARRPTRRPRAGLSEALEEPGREVVRHAWAVVAYADLHPVPRVATLDLNRHS